MNALWECTNGWCGESYLRVYVWAETQDVAERMAHASFAAKAATYKGNRVEARLLFRADAEPFATEPDDSGWPIEPRPVIGKAAMNRRDAQTDGAEDLAEG